MGTVFTFDVRCPGQGPAAAAVDRAVDPAVDQAVDQAVEQAVDQAVEWLRWVDRTFSTYVRNSEVNRFDRGELDLGSCCEEFASVLSLCHEMGERTAGSFDAWAGGHYDPSGLVKGWSIEEASAMLRAAGWPDHAIDGGGDVRLAGVPCSGGAWQVGIRHPHEKGAFCAALSLPECAVATSGNYERGPHVTDPRTGAPATALASVTVIGPELTSADAYATAAFAMGREAPAWLARLAGYEALVVYAAGDGWATPGFEGYCSPVAPLRPA